MSLLAISTGRNSGNVHVGDCGIGILLPWLESISIRFPPSSTGCRVDSCESGAVFWGDKWCSVKSSYYICPGVCTEAGLTPWNGFCCGPMCWCYMRLCSFLLVYAVVCLQSAGHQSE
ncbi:uncharacterized protein LOC108707549 [Xenopus laevis]|uniref:Uncharacterized protein LOC108707549 n=1 Tax=Xenopus laevis TaxID=8355 RepID=A0A8J0UCU2_XENLA|nr:uncharacterized protein LOC108707549 [Xenopus laevis]